MYKPWSSAIWKGSHNPILRGRNRSPWLITTTITITFPVGGFGHILQTSVALKPLQPWPPDGNAPRSQLRPPRRSGAHPRSAARAAPWREMPRKCPECCESFKKVGFLFTWISVGCTTLRDLTFTDARFKGIQGIQNGIHHYRVFSQRGNT